MPRNTKCNHLNCDGGPCKQLTPEELAPREEDRELGRRLADEGWVQASRKYRTIARLRDDFPRFDEVFSVREDYRGSTHEQEMRQRWEHWRSICLSDNRYVEEKTLTVREMQAFRDACEATAGRWPTYLPGEERRAPEKAPHADGPRANLRALADDAGLLETIERRMNETLSELRDLRISLPFAQSGLVIREEDGGDSFCIRLTPAQGLAAGLRALAEHLDETR